MENFRQISYEICSIFNTKMQISLMNFLTPVKKVNEEYRNENFHFLNKKYVSISFIIFVCRRKNSIYKNLGFLDKKTN